MNTEQYLNTKGIPFTRRNGELIIKCPFNGCDDDSRGVEAHFYIGEDSGLYTCHKCGEKGNLITLARHFSDDPKELGLIETPNHIGAAVRKRVKQIEDTIPPDQIDAWHNALPVPILDWLKKERGLSDSVIKTAKIGWDGERVIIPIFDHNRRLLFTKRRQAPGNEDNGPKYQYAKGAKAALYGVEDLKNADSVVICEGEFDALILRSNGFLAVTGTGGAGTFPEEWAKLFSKVEEVYILFDNDDAGRQGALKVGRLMPHAKIVALPNEVGDHGDATDFFIKLGKTPDDLGALLKQGRTALEIDEQGERYFPLPAAQKQISIDAWRKTIGERFPECFAAAEVGLAVTAQLLIKDVRNPFGLVYVDVPSAGKTITLNFFSDLNELVYSTDNFTPSSLVSHATNRKREDLEKIDLLPRIRFKTVIVRDLAPIFADRQEVLLKNLGVLTRVFDGEGYESDSGVHGKRGYRGDYTFMFLAASTPIAPRVWKFMGNLGSRLFFINLNARDKSEEELADLLVQDDFKHKEGECRTATRDFVLGLWSRHKGGIIWNKIGDPRQCLAIISRCAQLLANLRGTVNVWSGEEDGKQQHTNVVIEQPMRINQLMYNLARGHALACGRTQIEEQDLWPVIEVTLNSAPYNRIKLIEALIANQGTANTTLVEWAINCSNPTALKEIETLRVLKLVNIEEHATDSPGRPEKIITLKNEFSWFASEECQKIRGMKPLLN